MDTPKTAAQINDPQTGRVEIHKTKIQPKTEPTNEGWWSIRNLRGSITGVFQKIEADPSIPPRWKAAIKDDISACCEGANFVTVDAHYFVVAGKASLHLTVFPETVA
jgi:hypothetical protein